MCLFIIIPLLTIVHALISAFLAAVDCPQPPTPNSGGFVMAKHQGSHFSSQCTEGEFPTVCPGINITIESSSPGSVTYAVEVKATGQTIDKLILTALFSNAPNSVMVTHRC